MKPGSSILIQLIDGLASQKTGQIHTLMHNQKIYFIGPNAIGEMRTELSKWDSGKTKRRWLGSIVEGSNLFVPKPEYADVSRCLQEFADAPSPSIYSALEKYAQEEVFIATTDKNQYERPRISALWAMNLNSFAAMYLWNERSMSPHNLEYRLETKYWRITFPGENGLQLERRNTVYTAETLEQHPFRENYLHPGDTAPDDELALIMMAREKIEALQTKYRRLTTKTMPVADATLK